MMQLVTADRVDPAVLGAFLDRIYPPAKSAFLKAHGTWLHGGDENRWVLCDEHKAAKITGYCAVIPSRVLIRGEERRAIWWVDLVIDPAYRGQGLQTRFDTRVREMEVLKLGFPNELAAKIHRKHGWGVREDLRVLLLPLRPRELRQVRRGRGWWGAALRLGALAAEPLARLWRGKLARGSSREMGARRVALEEVEPEKLAGVFRRHAQGDVATTVRDAAYWRWRFLDAPYREELKVYLAGPVGAPAQVLVMRWLIQDGQKVARVLDLAGDFSDQAAWQAVLRLAVGETAEWGAVQVTCLATLPRVRQALRRVGFVLGATARFCWHGSPAAMQGLGEAVHWTLADSDNDQG